MAEPLLQIRNLTKSFGALKATNDVSIDLRPGEVHALIGPNGAGKSTLMHLISGFLKPDSGSILFDGQDVSGIDMAGRARLGLGRTFQISSLAPDFSALRNVMLAVQARQGSSFRFIRPVRNDASLIEPAMAALERAGLAARARIPAAELSHGERRQLEIAMALALGAKAFLFDEPMAGMGPESAKTLTTFLDRLRREAPVLLIEHDMDAVFALADRISVLVYGSVIATGTVEEIRRNADVRSAYLGDTP
ncbi:branched-chain amino acid transport system ATP-binding protein [Bosea sp. CRIB-10]|uniref:ABC transporter ATP-binding protein n=1 Tax=Bosea sp. CRIB-10 TaxID=378404 RepID=UPI0008F39F98|nr:ABC transporter ATP-binding protein [Bosea sp. CRIB-10]SFB78257.1 branched-chain amino acid transport system ATP-binding protein [Bosea sp. CRIB-10]